MKLTLISYTHQADSIAGMAARQCYSGESITKIPRLENLSEESKEIFLKEYDRNINALKKALSCGHESVVEHVSFTFNVDGISRACSHQLVRHRHASFSQQSQRYVNGFTGIIIPPSIKNNPKAYDMWTSIIGGELEPLYDYLIELGIPQEDARYVLPNAAATTSTFTMNARELLHFFRLRCCSRAQWEIRELANGMLKICKEYAPVIFASAGAPCANCPEGSMSCRSMNTNVNAAEK